MICIKNTFRCFTPLSVRTIYYHLSQGVKLGLFSSVGTQRVKGDYSWGEGVDRNMFKLGPSAAPKGSDEVLKKLQNLAKK